MSNIKTVVIINDFDYVNGGASKVAINTAEGLANVGIKVYFFSAVHGEYNWNKQNIEFITTNQKESLNDKNKIRGALNGIYNVKAKKKLEELLDTLDKKTTIVHIHTWIKALSSSIFSAICKKNFKFVVTFHDYFSMCPNGGFYNYKKNEICKYEPLSLNCIRCNCDSRNYFFKIYRILRQFVQNKIVKINEKIDNVISISDFSRNILIKGLKKDVNIMKISNPIDIQKEIEIKPSKNNYYIYVGRVSKEKGVDLFCNAITNLNCEGIVVGDGNQREILEKKYPNIQFKGWKNKNEVKEYMKKARALVFPSLWYEGAPLTVLEAMAIGLPCIVSDCSAAKENIENEYTGLIYKSKEVEELEKKIKKCNKNDFINRLGLNSYKKYWNSGYGKEKYTKEVIEFYNKILS